MARASCPTGLEGGPRGWGSVVPRRAGGQPCGRRMAQWLALRRLLSLTPRTLPPQGQRALPDPLAPWGLPAPYGRAFGSSAACGNTFNVQDGSDFQDRVVNNPKPVVVDFHAQWCGPCKILGPRLEKMVAKQEGKVLMAKVDIDDHTDLAIEYEVSAVPTVLAMKNGDVVDKFVGIKDEDQLEAFLKKLIGA
ncbi:thioredoxin, mitochondrial isoform X2 [Caloenas nicobarica]|uniref:thioredoxin, mitochondrial isoform X2 n=1 Tax=Caloenas nicobarica TaxID=187106 RepID=UPI0032B7FBEE